MKRIAYFDNAKGILIILIILAHVFSLCSNYYHYNDDFFKFAALFMLQCFFFISAYFSSKSKTPRKKRIISLLKIYLLWQTIITIYYSFVLNIIDFNLNYMIPRYTLWFLITMITYNLLEFILEKCQAKVMIPLSFIVGLLAGFLPFIGETLSLSRSFVFFPFYVLGYYAKDLDLLTKIKTNKVKLITIITSCLILILILNFNNLLPIKILKGKFSYSDINSANILLVCGQRILFYVFSITVSIAFMNLVPKKESVLTTLGRNTLYIYLTQGMILKTFVTEKILLNNRVVGTLLLFICAFILTIIFTKVINRVQKIAKYKESVANG